MNLIKSHRRLIAVAVIVTFAGLLHVASMPLAAHPAAVAKARADESDTPRVIEEEPEGGTKAKKKSALPIILGVVGVAAIVAVVLLSKKAKTTLTVDTDSGVNGTPAAGSYEYKKNDTLSYSFSPKSGFTNLTVTLDGAAVAASGTVKMDKNHTLSARTQAIDLRGTWNVSFSATNTVKTWNWDFQFAGGATQGTIHEPYNDFWGTFLVTGNSIVIRCRVFDTDDLVMNGTVSSSSAMNGTAVLTNLTIGDINVTGANWTATKTGSSSAGYPAKVGKVTR